MPSLSQSVFDVYVKVSNLRFPFLAILFFSGASFLNAEKDVEKLESTYKVERARFETETRSELSRIARDKSLAGEEKIIRIENWFATQAERIAQINRMADALDQSKPLVRPTHPPRPAATTPDGIAAAKLHQLNLRMSKGEISRDEFDRLRKPIADQLSALQSSLKPAQKPHPTPATKSNLALLGNEQELAEALHTQNRYLTRLPKDVVAAIRADEDSDINRLYHILGDPRRENIEKKRIRK